MSSRVRLRRRLLLFSAPVVIVALVAAYKLIAVVIVGNAAVSDFAHRDIGALRDDMSTLEFLNVVEPDKVAFGQGLSAALSGELQEADTRFTDLLSRTDNCPVRINVELVRETRGDLAARDGLLDEAEQFYLDALAVVTEAPQGCFADNTDPDQDRRAIRHDAAARLEEKIRALRTTMPSPAATTPVAPPPPPRPPPRTPPSVLGNINPDRLPGSGPVPELRLEPGSGNPLERLQEALGNSSAAG